MIIGCAINTNAQSLQIHTGVTLPMGDFADDDVFNDYAGMANTGFNIGVKSYLPLGKSNFSFGFGFDFFLNGLQSKYKKEFDVSPMYLHIPLTIGLNYSYSLLKNKIKIYGEVGIGPNCSMMTQMSSNTNLGSIYFYPSYGFGYNMEGGFLLKWFQIGFRYYYLGNHSYSPDLYWSYLNDFENPKRKISNLQLVVGFNF